MQAERYTRDPIKRYHARYSIIGDCWIWQDECDKDGYAMMSIAGKRTRVSRFVCVVFHEAIGPGDFACHSCDNPSCVNPAHIFKSTPKGNSQDMVTKDRQAKGFQGKPAIGVSQRDAKLNDTSVRAIRLAYDSGQATRRQLQERYNVSKATIRDVVLRRLWKHVV